MQLSSHSQLTETAVDRPYSVQITARERTLSKMAKLSGGLSALRLLRSLHHDDAWT